VTTEEAAILTGLSQSYINHAALEGKIASVKIGGVRFVLGSSLDGLANVRRGPKRSKRSAVVAGDYHTSAGSHPTERSGTDGDGTSTEAP
jgi:hypothetical protein